MTPADSKRVRVAAALLGASAIALGLGVRAALSGPFAKYGGVGLWSMLVYALIVLMRPAITPLRAGFGATVISFAVELFQLTPFPTALARAHVAFALVLGTTFNWPDFPAYAAGVAIGALVHHGVRHGLRSR
jgi:hypothetical protein